MTIRLLAAHASRTVTVWLAIDTPMRETPACGFARSHHRRLTWRDARRRSTMYPIKQLKTPSNTARRSMTAAAGEVSIHSDLLLHGSNAFSQPSRCVSPAIPGLRPRRPGLERQGRDPQWPRCDATGGTAVRRRISGTLGAASVQCARYSIHENNARISVGLGRGVWRPWRSSCRIFPGLPEDTAATGLWRSIFRHPT